MKTNLEVEEKFSRIARSLIGDKEISFSFSGNEYYCRKINNTFHINFASLPPKPDFELLKALEGFLDHEVGHALYTDFSVLENLKKEAKKQDITREKEIAIIKTLFNILEDYRIEKEVKKKYIGSTENIDFMNQYALRRLEKNISEFEGWQLIELALAYLINQYKLPDDFKEAADYLRLKIENELQLIPKMESSKEALEITFKIYKKIKEDSQEDEDSENQDSDNQESGQEEQEHKDENEQKDAQESCAQENENSEGENAQDSCAQENENPEGENAQDSCAENLAELPKEGNEKDNSDVLERMKKLGEEKNLDSAWKEKQFFDYVKENYISNYDEGPELPRPFTRKHDKISIKKYRLNREYKIETGLGYHANKLSALIKAETLQGWKKGLDRGRLSYTDIYRITTDDLFFKKKESPVLDINTVFCVGVDNSISLKPEIAFKILTCIYEILGRINVPFEVFSYTTLYSEIVHENPEFRDFIYSGEAANLNFSRVLPLYINVLKNYDDNYCAAKGYLNMGPQGYTPTPEAYEYAIHSLKKRKEKKKIFINITDGLPQEIHPDRNVFYYIRMLKNLMLMCKDENIIPINIGFEIHEYFEQIDANYIQTKKDNFLDVLISVIAKKMRY